MRSVRVYRQQIPGFRLLAGTGTPSLSETIDLTKLAFDIGYDGVVVLPPYYFRKATDEGLFKWFSELITKAVPANKYLLGYHIPSVSGVGFSLDLIARLKDVFPKQFAGIKNSSHDEAYSYGAGSTLWQRLARPQRHGLAFSSRVKEPCTGSHHRARQFDLRLTCAKFGICIRKAKTHLKFKHELQNKDIFLKNICPSRQH